MKAQVAGKYQLTVLRLDGSIKAQTPWFDNLITNTGLNILGGVGSTGTLTAQVGSGTTPPDVTDTAIETLVASTTSESASNTSQVSSSPYFARRRTTFTFAIGAIQTTISEVAIRFANLFSRALIVNELGQPTPLTLGGIDQLILTYDFYQYFVGTQEFAFDVNGVTQSGLVTVGAGLMTYMVGLSTFIGGTATFPIARSASGIGTPGSNSLAGQSGDMRPSSAASYAYSSGNYYRDFFIEFNAARGGLTGFNGLTELFFYDTTNRFKVYWSPGFNKTNLETVRLEGRFAWGRYVP